MAVHQETTPDLNPETLAALSQLMLAQAQEVITYKCIRGMHFYDKLHSVPRLLYCKNMF